MRADEIAARFQQPGKQRVRQLLVDVANIEGCESVLDFWGGGESARIFTAQGMDVVSAEVERKWWPALAADAQEFGYRAHFGNASQAEGEFDLVFADFCGGASPETLKDLRALATRATRLLAVTLSPDHQLDRTLQGPMANYTLPSWLIGATGFSLEHIRRYVRNDFGQTMWFAILRPTPPRGYVINPMTIDRALRRTRRAWSSKEFLTVFGDALRHSVCVYCGGDVFGERIDRKYCSDRCKWNAAYPRKASYKKAHSPKPCAHCGIVIADRIPKQRYHPECAREVRLIRERVRRRSLVNPRPYRWIDELAA